MDEKEARLRALIEEAKQLAVEKGRAAVIYFLSLAELDLNKDDIQPDIPPAPAPSDRRKPAPSR